MQYFALLKKKTGVFNIGSGEETTVTEMSNITKRHVSEVATLNISSEDREVNQGAVDNIPRSY